MLPDVADEAPTFPVLTGYDDAHLLTYIRLLDAAAEDADWREVAKIVLHIDPETEAERAFRAWETHLARAQRSPARAHVVQRDLLADDEPVELRETSAIERPVSVRPGKTPIFEKLLTLTRRKAPHLVWTKEIVET